MPKPIKGTMTPEEIATFWYQKSVKLEEKLADTEDYWFKHSRDLEDKLAQSEATRRDLANEIGDLKNKYTALELIVTDGDERPEARIYKLEMRARKAESAWGEWRDACYEAREKLKKLSDEIGEKDTAITIIPKITYEQIIDLKCENARLKEENAKFAKWKRILDKFKIF